MFLSPDQIDVADMQCWAFRLAQDRWGVSARACADVFEKYGLLGFIEECYGILHVSGYESVVDELETIVRRRGGAECLGSTNS